MSTNTTRTSRFATIVCAAMLVANAAAAGEIVWLDRQQALPMFIPGTVLAQPEWAEEAGISEQIRESIQADLGRRKLPAEGDAAANCEPVRIYAEDPATYGPVDLPQALDTADLGVIATITTLSGGWDAWNGRPGTLAEVRVVEVLHDPDSTLRKGQALRFLLPYGSIEAAGGLVCTSQQAGYYAPRDGDRILLIGSRFEGEPRLVISQLVFPVENDSVPSRAFTPHRAATAVSLHHVRAVVDVLKGVER